MGTVKRWTVMLVMALILGLAGCSDDGGVAPGVEAGADAAIPDALPPDGPAPLQTHKKEVGDLVKPLMDGDWTVGLMVGLASAQGVEFYAFGKTAATGAAPDQDTLFEIASITKTFTSLMLAQMVKEGAVTLSQPVQALLPAAKVTVPTYGGKEITLQHLSTHTSGLPYMPTNHTPKDPRLPFADYNVTQLYAMLNGYTLTRAPGATWEYNNLAVGLLGHALSLKDAKTYEAMLAARITGPLKLKDTAITLSAAQTQRLAQGHDCDLKVAPHSKFDVMAPAGALRSSARDLLAYVEAQAGLAQSSMAAVMAETHRTQHSGPPTMGLGWIINEGRYHWHNGGVRGFESFCGFDKQARVAVVVLANSNSAWQPVTNLGLAALAMMAKQSYQPPSLPATLTVPTATLDLYAGTYKSAAGYQAVVKRTGSALYLTLTLTQSIGTSTYRMYASATDKFYLRAAKVGITFTKDSKGIYSSLELATTSGKATFTRVP